MHGLSSFIGQVSLFHLNILFLLGIGLFGGTIGGRLFQKFKIPQVVGYIAIGILIGESGFKLVDHATIMAFRPFNYFALGLIGFMIGGELKKDIILKYGKQFIIILLSEGIITFAFVTIIVGTVCTFIFDNSNIAWALGIILGAISSATAPAATSSVLWENKTRGPLTRTILGIVAMDDGLALILFALSSAVASVLLGTLGDTNILMVFVHPIIEMGGAVILGIASGALLNYILHHYNQEDRILAFSIGIVLLILGIALALNLDMILAAMIFGFTVVNFSPRRSKEVFKLIEKFHPPINVLFFVLVGAKIKLTEMSSIVLLVGFLYLLGRSVGKMSGAFIGSRISGAAKSVQKYLPLCLFSQAGVAIGLSILAGQRFNHNFMINGKEVGLGNIIVIIITAATFIVEVLGPAFVKIGVSKAGEIGLNITEEDLLKMSFAKDVMEPDVVNLPEHAPLAEILETFSQNDNLHYPVLNNSGEMLGVITIDNIKDTFMAQELSEFLLAHDLMEAVEFHANEQTPLLEVIETMNNFHVDYLPILDDENKFKGIIENRLIEKYVSMKIIEYEKKAVYLETS